MKEIKIIRAIFLRMIMILFLSLGFGLLSMPPVAAALIPELIFEEDLDYNGQAQVLARLEPQAGEAPLDLEKIAISYQGTQLNGHPYPKTERPPINAGLYTVTASYLGDDYYQEIEKRQQVAIRPLGLHMDQFFTPSALEKTYDGTTQAKDLVIDDLSHRQILQADQDGLMIGFGSGNYLYKDANTPNQLILSGLNLAGEKSQNYLIQPRTKEELADLEKINENRDPKDKIKATDILLEARIMQKPIRIYLTSGDKSYDGTANLISHGFSINQGDLVSGEKIEIVANAAFSPWYGTENAKIKDVGSHRVYAQGGVDIIGLNGTIGDNYRPDNSLISSRVTYLISPVAIIVTPAYRYKYEGEEDPLLTYSVWQVTTNDQLLDGLFGGDSLSGSLAREPGETPGLYDINQGNLANANYLISLENGANKFEILDKKSQAVVNVGGSDYSSSDSTRGKWDEIATPEALFAGGLILLIIVVAGTFYVRSKLTNLD